MQDTQSMQTLKWREKTLHVDGLDYASCARELQEVICRLDNVGECSLTYATGKLHLRYQGSLDKIKNLVKAHGYQLRESHEEEKGDAVAAQRVKQAAWAALFLLLAVVASAFYQPLSIPFLLVTIIVGGQTTFRRAWQALLQRRLDMNVLMTTAVIGAIIIGEWWEGSVVAFLFAASNALETYTTEKNRRSIRTLMREMPEAAHKLVEGIPETVNVATIADGDLILVRPGEQVPLDGVVIDGVSWVNEAAITGEAMPQNKEQGSRVYAGTLNGNGSLTVRVTGTWQDSTLTKIVRLVEEAQEHRVPLEQFVDRFARVYTPVVMLLAAAVAVMGPLTQNGTWGEWIYKGLALLLVACPCSLVLAAPVTVVAALTNAARQGVLIKGGVFLEAMGTVQAILFDKTGTLTKGEPEVKQIYAAGDFPEDEVLAVAAGLEAHSEHLLARAVRQKAEELGIKPLLTTGFTAIAGKGIQGVINDKFYLVGSLAYLNENGIATEELQQLPQRGETVIAVACEKRLLGALLIKDSVRKEGAPVIEALRQLGIKSMQMLTGDRQQAAAALGIELGLDRVRAELLPQDKEKTVRQMTETWGQVAMVGDGINDAPALAAATVGIAMGAAGSPTALETADVALMGDDLTNLPYLIRLGRQATAVIRQNIVLSLLIKTIAILLVFPGWLSLWLAIVADMGASLLVTLNGMRLLTFKKKA